MTDIPGENLLSHLPNVLAFISQVQFFILPSIVVQDDMILELKIFAFSSSSLRIFLQLFPNRGRPKVLYWFTATTAGPAQPPLSLLFSWQRYNLFIGRTINNTKIKMMITMSMLQYRITVEAALAMVRSVRPSVQPNPGFMAQLRSEINIKQD